MNQQPQPTIATGKKYVLQGPSVPQQQPSIISADAVFLNALRRYVMNKQTDGRYLVEERVQEMKKELDELRKKRDQKMEKERNARGGHEEGMFARERKNKARMIREMGGKEMDPREYDMKIRNMDGGMDRGMGRGMDRGADFDEGMGSNNYDDEGYDDYHRKRNDYDNEMDYLRNNLQAQQKDLVSVASLKSDVDSATAKSLRRLTESIEQGARNAQLNDGYDIQKQVDKISRVVNDHKEKVYRDTLGKMYSNIQKRCKIYAEAKSKLDDKRASIKTFDEILKVISQGELIHWQQYNPVLTALKKRIDELCGKLAQDYVNAMAPRKVLKKELSKRLNPLRQSIIDASFRGQFDRFPKLLYEPSSPDIVSRDSTNFSTPYNILIEKKFLNGLFDDQWISSAVIASYCKVAGQLFNWGNDKKDECYVISDSEVMGMKNPAEFASTRNASDRIFTPDRKRVVVVINKNNMHWVCIGIMVQDCKAYLYDSMFSAGTYHEYLNNVSRYAQWERNTYYPNSPISSFRLVEEPEAAIRQKNGSDCGLCTIINMTKFMKKDFKKGFNIEFEYDRIRHLRFGLYMFCIYLIICNREKLLPSLDKMLYCTYGVIMERKYQCLMDLTREGELD